MEKKLLHSNEFHLIDPNKIHAAVEQMVETLELAAGSTCYFDLYRVVEAYFIELEHRKEINLLLEIHTKSFECTEEECACFPLYSSL